jgi:thiamine-monophosphate kinase
MIDVGEKAFLHNLLPSLTTAEIFLNGFGQDASVVDIGLPDFAVAFKIDRAARPIAAFHGWTSFEVWGRLAVAANISDILAVGARPTAFMLSVTVPAIWDESRVREIISGAAKACAFHDVAFVGGDTKEGAEPNVVGAAIGVVSKHNIVSRRSAREGNVVVLAGYLGGFVGSYLLKMHGLSAVNPDEDRCLAYPDCAWDEANYLFPTYTVSSAIDLSDGLAEGLRLLTDLHHGVLVDVDKLPLHKSAREAAQALNINPLNFAFTVGDWGMLFTMSEEDAQNAIKSAPVGLKLSIIGKIVGEKKAGFFSPSSNIYFDISHDLTNEHFRRRMESETDYFSEITKFSVLEPVSKKSPKKTENDS